VDPLLFADNNNFYLCVRNAPTVMIDPTGQRSDCVERVTEVVDRQPSGGATTGNVGITITTVMFRRGFCGEFMWEIKFGFRVPASIPKPSFILQKLVVTAAATRCDGTPIVYDKIPGGRFVFWEAWPYGDPRAVNKELFANGQDVFSASSSGLCTKGQMTFFGTYGLVKGIIAIPPFASPNPDVPFTSGPASTIDPKVATTAAMRNHVIRVEWDCCC
jgi:hypothetical protein